MVTRRQCQPKSFHAAELTYLSGRSGESRTNGMSSAHDRRLLFGRPRHVLAVRGEER